MDKLLLRPKEAAEALGICKTKVYTMMSTGELPGVIRIGGSVRISKQALEKWVTEQTQAN